MLRYQRPLHPCIFSHCENTAHGYLNRPFASAHAHKHTSYGRHDKAQRAMFVFEYVRDARASQWAERRRRVNLHTVGVNTFDPCFPPPPPPPPPPLPITSTTTRSLFFFPRSHSFHHSCLKGVQARHKPCGAPQATKQDKKMAAVSFNGEVIERTNSLRYLGVPFDRMLTNKTQVESAKLRCKKGLSALKYMFQKALNNVICSCCIRVRYSTSLTVVWVSQPCHSLTC